MWKPQDGWEPMAEAKLACRSTFAETCLSRSARHAGDLSKENCIQAFRQHTEDVEKRVPAEHLLIWKPQDGWEPLAK